MKLICTASKVSWFTVGREYETDERMRVNDDDNKASLPWIIEPYNGGYRTERLNDAEFSVITETGGAALQQDSDALLADIRKMADDEGLREIFDLYLIYFGKRYSVIPKDNSDARRAFLLALAYFGEEKQNDL